MNTIDIVDRWPYAPKDVLIKSFRLNGLTFTQFAAAAKAAGRAKTDAEARRLRFREQMKLQLQAIDAKGAALRLDDEAIAQIPAFYAARIRDAMTLALFPEGAGEAKIETEGDGYSTPIHIAFGSPIKAADGKEIAEVEFKAGTIMDLEEVLSLDNGFDQTEALLGLARPADGKLLRLPDWAKAQLSLADGLFIMNKIRPVFLDAPTSF